MRTYAYTLGENGFTASFTYTYKPITILAGEELARSSLFSIRMPSPRHIGKLMFLHAATCGFRFLYFDSRLLPYLGTGGVFRRWREEDFGNTF